MRLPLLRTLSARIVLGFAVLILTFGTTTVLTVAYMDELGREIHVIRTGYIMLALRTADLAEKQRALHAYLKDELEGEPTPARVQRRVQAFRVSRGELLRKAAQVIDDLSDVPARHADRMHAARAALADLGTAINSAEDNYAVLLRAPPIERMTAGADGSAVGPAPAWDLQKIEAAKGGLGKLITAESQILSQANQLAEGLGDPAQGAVVRIAKALEKNEGRLRSYTMYLGLTAVLVGMLITLWATLTLRPLRRLRDAARRIASGDYASRIAERGPDEVAELAAEFNIMGRAIEERERELVRSERLVAVGKMAATITHEVRNPLSSIGLNTELLEEELARLPADRVDEARSLCRAITAEVDRLTAITEEYLKFARLPKPRVAAEPINGVVAQLAEFEREQLAAHGVTLEVVLGVELPLVLIDEAQLRQVLLNLIRNASEAIQATGRGTVRVSTRRGAADTVEVEVADDGLGIAPELLSKLFDPFFSTKQGGTGLGLALTDQIVREHGGEISVTSDLGKGARFVVALPIAPSPASRPET